MKKLFEILSWKRDEDFIVVQIDENKYTESNTIIVPEHKFEIFLRRHDRLYYETHDISTGQYQSKSYELSMDEYFSDMHYTDVADDLYDYISVRHIDFDKAYKITENAIQSLMKYFL